MHTLGVDQVILSTPGNCVYRDTSNGDNKRIEGYEYYTELPIPKGTLNAQKYWRRYVPIYDENDPHWVKGYVSTNGQFTNQNMSVYAMSGEDARKVKIYTLGFASNLDDDVEDDLSILSQATGGWYQWAGDAATIKQFIC